MRHEVGNQKKATLDLSPRDMHVKPWAAGLGLTTEHIAAVILYLLTPPARGSTQSRKRFDSSRSQRSSTCLGYIQPKTLSCDLLPRQAEYLMGMMMA